MGSFKAAESYYRVDEEGERSLWRQMFKGVIIVVVSSLILAAVIVGVVGGTVQHKLRLRSSVAYAELTSTALVKRVCSVTLYPESCYSSISTSDSSNTSDTKAIFRLSLRIAMDELSMLSGYPSGLGAMTKDTRLKAALTVCENLLGDARYSLNKSMALMAGRKGDRSLSPADVGDMRTWLSAIIVDQETCFDALEELNDLNSSKDESSRVFRKVKAAMQNSMKFSSNSLAILTNILGSSSRTGFSVHNKMFIDTAEKDFMWLPDWILPIDKGWLADENPMPHMTVAQDGSGNFTTIMDALNAVPNKSKARFVIHLKAGLYVEHVILSKDKWNVMIYGDGADKTIVSNNLHAAYVPTYFSATFAVEGEGFIGKDIKFVNTAGPHHQAVAFRSKADKSVLYRCAMDGYQDTLYVHANRQFYRECNITGNVDFIFGHGIAVFQNCTIQSREVHGDNLNTITAHGASDPNQLSGLSILNSTFSPLGDLSRVTTYFGRPWKNYSTVVIMKSDIGDFVDPKGWIPWGPQVSVETVFIGEYKNRGPGANVDHRVNWPGYRPRLTDFFASLFTVGTFIQGDDWLPETGVPYDEFL